MRFVKTGDDKTFRRIHCRTQRPPNFLSPCGCCAFLEVRSRAFNRVAPSCAARCGSPVWLPGVAARCGCPLAARWLPAGCPLAARCGCPGWLPVWLPSTQNLSSLRHHKRPATGFPQAVESPRAFPSVSRVATRAIETSGSRRAGERVARATRTIRGYHPLSPLVHAIVEFQLKCLELRFIFRCRPPAKYVSHPAEFSVELQLCEVTS